MEQRKELMWTAVMDTVETGWIFLQGIGAPEGISLAGPGLVPPNWDFGEYLTEVLETLRAPNSICTDCGGDLRRSARTAQRGHAGSVQDTRGV
jgi:hypothetical protein